jgi:hypothetical protein
LPRRTFSVPRFRIDAAVVDPRRGDLDRTGGGHHLPRLRVTVTDHQPAAPGVMLVSEFGDVGVDLGFRPLSFTGAGDMPG